MRILVVGDVHAKANDLDDCRALGKHVEAVARAQRPQRILFMGDQYDTHAMVHVEVQAFWIDLLARLNSIAPVVCLVGNHDMVGNGVETRANAMQVHTNIEVVGENPHVDASDVVYLGYGGDPTKVAPCEWLFCHHTFQGAQYDNGFYAKDGIDANSVPAKYIVSGHIHTPASFGKVTYVGAPRWLTVSDAAVTERNIFIVDTYTNTWEAYPTNDYVRVIRRLTDTETAPAAVPAHKPQDQLVVDVVGSAGYVEERAKAFKLAGCRVRTFVQGAVKSAVKESEGIGQSWGKFVGLYRPPYGTPKEVLVKKAEEL